MKVVVLSSVVVVAVAAHGWGGDSVVVAREGKWCRGSGRSGDYESFWFRRKNPAGKVFRRRPCGGGWPAGGLPDFG
nr:hypothetical protein [Tanacetum cinerariifolium]GFB04587.1 hypothetical protein [Tanacetum cinerariifolium]